MRQEKSGGDETTWIAAAVAGLVGVAIVETATRGDVGVAITCVIALAIASRLAAEACQPARRKLQPIRIRARQSVPFRHPECRD
jgi:TRAP-type uncharacterized transport system fused permease subunit